MWNKFNSIHVIPHTWATGRPQKFFQGVGQSGHFAYPFQISDNATQMDVHKSLHPFYTTKKGHNVTATDANSVTFKRQFYTEQMFVLVSMNILRLSYQAELQTVWVIKINIKSYQNTTKYTSNSNRFCLFSCCLKLRPTHFSRGGEKFS